MDSISLRLMTEADVPQAAALSRAFGWSHRAEDWSYFLGVGEGLVAEADGQVVGTVMACRHGANLATLGMMIVAENAQGIGLGRSLMQAMISSLNGATIVLQATENGLPLYAKLGFKSVGTLHQHQGIAPGIVSFGSGADEAIVPLHGRDDEIAFLYSTASGANRKAVVDKLLADDRGVVWKRDGNIKGFAVLRRFGRGWYIAPVVAADVDIAKALISHLLRKIKGEFARADVVGGTGLSNWLEDLGFPDVDIAQTMALGSMPRIEGNFTVFAVTAQALG